jgi:hypothetical protein
MNKFIIDRTISVHGQIPEWLFMTFANMAIEKYGSLEVAVSAACFLLLKKEGIDVSDKYLSSCGCRE